jgi:hypothetical protein
MGSIGKGKGTNIKSTVISFHPPGHGIGGDMCPCASVPPVPKKPCPESGNTGIPKPGDGTTPLPGEPGTSTASFFRASR